jgi:hypothetical protein
MNDRSPEGKIDLASRISGSYGASRTRENPCVAKTVFQRNQKVWVESVGAWATIDKIVPVWAKGFDEPVRVTYDVGLGREFQAHELKAGRQGRPTAGGRRRQLAHPAGPQQVAAGERLPAPSLSRHLSGGGHRSQRLGRLAHAGRRVRSRSAQDRVPGPADRRRAARCTPWPASSSNWPPTIPRTRRRPWSPWPSAPRRSSAACTRCRRPPRPRWRHACVEAG